MCNVLTLTTVEPSILQLDSLTFTASSPEKVLQRLKIVHDDEKQQITPLTRVN